MLPGAPSLSYGVGKAGVHYAAKKMHDEEEKIVVLPVHPGYVDSSDFDNDVGVEG
jgi:NAD(P)-dependent dehydrogenase (short-subunit alcohol dehydrogenase family)